jgi:hypothetical protein
VLLQATVSCIAINTDLDATYPAFWDTSSATRSGPDSMGTTPERTGLTVAAASCVRTGEAASADNDPITRTVSAWATVCVGWGT